jgi:3' exoribonuclease, RNase T-like
MQTAGHNTMTWYVVDVESDGPIPHKYSMVCFGAVLVTDNDLSQTFYGKTRPISPEWNPESLAISGFSREQHEAFDDPQAVLKTFVEWVDATSKGRPIFVSDNPAYDWQWINYYCHYYIGRNPFGYSARRIGDLYAGFQKDAQKSLEWRKYKRTKHSHNPVDDALGNAEALQEIAKMGLRIRF